MNGTERLDETGSLKQYPSCPEEGREDVNPSIEKGIHCLLSLFPNHDGLICHRS